MPQATLSLLGQKYERSKSEGPTPVLPCGTPAISLQDHASGAAPAVSSPQEKVGVLLLNLGGPESLQDVKPFLYNLFADPDIIRVPWFVGFIQPLIAFAISTLRAPKSREAYKSIGGGSPLRRITDEQAQALKAALHAKGVDANMYVGMRYWHPFTEEAVEQIKKDGIERLIILPLYPQYSISTSGSSIRCLEYIFAKDSHLKQLKHSVIPSWYERKGYINAMADLTVQELVKFDKPEEVEIFFSAHGVPKTYVEKAGECCGSPHHGAAHSALIHVCVA